MTIKALEGKVKAIEDNLLVFSYLTKNRVLSVEKDVTKGIKDFRHRAEYNVGKGELQLLRYTTPLSFSGEYRVILSYDWGTPSLIAIILGVVDIVITVWKAIKWFAELIHLKDIVTVAEILHTIWPWFRKKMDMVFSKVSDFSEKLGWGVDGIIHLLQACDQGLVTTGALLGKDWHWLETVKSSRTMAVLETMSEKLEWMQNDPGVFMDWVFRDKSHKNMDIAYNWWDKTSKWIQNAADTAEEAIGKIKGTIDSFEKLRNEMPEFVRKHIPKAIWNGLDWSEKMIDEHIIPKLDEFNKAFDEVNAAIDEQRKKAESLVDELTRPGDVLLKIDDLTEESRKHQQDKIDDVTSRKYDEDVSKYEEEDAAILRTFELLDRLATTPIPEPSFLAIEERPYVRPSYPNVTVYDTWFVGDY